MNHSMQVKKIPYTTFGDMIFSGELIVIRINYDEGYTLVSDKDGTLWKATCDATDPTLTIAILTRVD